MLHETKRGRWGEKGKIRRKRNRGWEKIRRGEDLKCLTRVRKEHETKTGPLRTLLKEKCAHRSKKQCAERARESKDGGSSF